MYIRIFIDISFMYHIISYIMSHIPYILHTSFMYHIFYFVSHFLIRYHLIAMSPSTLSYDINACLIDHFLTFSPDCSQVVFELILGSNFDMDLLQTASETLFKLICVYQEEYMALAQRLLTYQKNSAVAERLRTAFSELTPATLKLSMEKSSVTAFRKNLEKFLLEIKGFLFFK